MSVMSKLFKTPAEREAEAARKLLAKQYEDEVLIPVSDGRSLMEDAEASFNERHRAVLIKIFGEKGAPSTDLDPFDIG